MRNDTHSVTINSSDQEVKVMNKSELRNRRMQSLDKGKIKSLGFFEKMTMKHAGKTDGRNGLLRSNEEGIWQSSFLKQEIDAFEEFCAAQYGGLKMEEEEEFRQMNILFDKVVPLRKKFSDSQALLEEAEGQEVDITRRKEGEENLTEVQVNARRTRERDEELLPIRKKRDDNKVELEKTVDEIFERLSQVKESFDSTVKITNRILQHSQMRVDVYWRSAMRYMQELPAVPNVNFTSVSEKAFRDHYENVVARAEKLRMELASEVNKEVA